MSDRNPFGELDELFDRMSRELDRIGEDIDAGIGGASVPVDVAEADGSVVVTADLPGFAPEDVEVTVQNRTVTIEAESETESETDDVRYHRRERRRRSVSRSVRLPVDVEEHEGEATHANGVLTVRFPKTATDEGHTIEVD